MSYIFKYQTMQKSKCRLRISIGITRIYNLKYRLNKLFVDYNTWVL